MHGCIQAGVVSSVNESVKTVRVAFLTGDSRVSGDLVVLDHVWAQQAPEVGDKVACAFTSPTDIRAGFVLGIYGGAG